MNSSIKVKLYPTIKQKKLLDNHFNAYRFCYNLALEYKIMMWMDYKINKRGFDLQNEIYEVRNQIDWLKACKADCLAYAGIQVDKSFDKFFSGGGYPNFKSKNGKQSFTSNQNCRIVGRCVKFLKRLIKFKTSTYMADKLSRQ